MCGISSLMYSPSSFLQKYRNTLAATFYRIEWIPSLACGWGGERSEASPPYETEKHCPPFWAN